MDGADLLARLTDKERDSLRRWLTHRTAKEIALDLGISHHAVEKRLKMARVKLGVATSLEAARILAEAEGYGLTGYGSPDLADISNAAQNGTTNGVLPAEARQNSRHSVILASGVIAMSLIGATAIGLFLAGPAPQIETTGFAQEPDRERIVMQRNYGATGERVQATPQQIGAYTRELFQRLDKDGSGYLEAGEVNVRSYRRKVERDADGNLRPVGPKQETSSAQASRDYIARSDSNSDGKLDLKEYSRAMAPMLHSVGLPKDWSGLNG